MRFGTTSSDQKNANQKVAEELVNGIKYGLEKANQSLADSEKIHSIYIMATTNGKHGPNSNHYQGTAIDISRINNKKMALSGVTKQIKELQKAFDKFEFVRENFGPYFKHKFSKERSEGSQWNYRHPIRGHKDHIHFSIRK